MPRPSTTRAEGENIPTGIKSIYPPILLLIAAGALIYRTFDYSETARQLPLLIGSGLVALIVLDLLSRTPGKAGALVRLALGAGFRNPELKHSPDWRAEIVQVVWILGCVAGIVFIGILPTIPLFIFLYMLVQGKQTIVFSLMTATVVVLVVGLVFELLLEYALYRGMLMNADSFG